MGFLLDLQQLKFLVRIWELFIQLKNMTLLQLNTTMMKYKLNKGNLQIIKASEPTNLPDLFPLYSLSVSRK